MNIIIADHNTIIKEGIKSLLKHLHWTIEDVSTTNELFSKIDNSIKNIILIEINFCNSGIKNIVQKIKSINPDSKILVLSDCNCELQVMVAVQSGITGYIHKNINQEELILAIETINFGRQYFTSNITKIITDSYLALKNPNHELSEREIEVLKHICKGKSNFEISEELFLSENTVATHKRNIMKKVGVKKSTDLILWAMENNIIQR